MNITTENKNTLEINIQSPSSPLVPLNIHNFVRDINVSIDTKIETTTTMNGGGTPQTNTNITGIFEFFKSFFKGFSHISNKHEKEPYLHKIFSSGNANITENKINLQDTTNILSNKSIKLDTDSLDEKKNSLREDEDEDLDFNNQEITKIILTTDDPEIILNDSLKGTKLFYLTQRTELPSQWV